eukprot:4389102-Prymnesium_polylepis.1
MSRLQKGKLTQAPQAWPSPGSQIAIPKMILVNANPGGQGKIATAHQILSSVQVDARTCQIGVPDESMSIMESKFDPTHKVTSAYLVSRGHHEPLRAT